MKKKHIQDSVSLAMGGTVEREFILVSNLAEASFNSESRVAELTVIQQGWSLNGFYYGAKPLASIVNLLNTQSEGVYLDHNPRENPFAPRKVADRIANNITAKLSDDGTKVISEAKFFSSGPNAWVFDRMQETRSNFGPSIVGKAKVKKGTVDGKEGYVVEDVTFLFSYDIVDRPAAGGKVNKLFETTHVQDKADAFGSVHLLEGLDWSVEDTPVTEGILSNKMDAAISREAAEKAYRDLYWTFESELSNIVLAREDWQFTPVAERRQAVGSLLQEFTEKVNGLTFLEPKVLPVGNYYKVSNQVTDCGETLRLQFSDYDGPKTCVPVSTADGIEALYSETSEFVGLSFDKSHSWTDTKVHEWTANYVRENENRTIEEGTDMFKTLAELKEKAPALYEALVAEAKGTLANESNKVDRTLLETANTELAAEKAKVAALEAEKKTLTETVTALEADKRKARIAEIIAQTKKEAGLDEKHCSEQFNKDLQALAFESEDAFTKEVKARVEDRKSLVDTTKKVIEGAGSNPPITEDKPKVLPNEEFAKKLKKS
jgi:hypothetical protein